MAIPRLRPSSPIDLNKNNAYKPPVPSIPLVAQQAIAAAHTGGSIPPMPKAAPSVSAPKDPFAAYGGKEHYAQSQQSRYNTAVTSGDTDMIGKLEADAQRAGYTLNKPAMPQTQPQPQPAIAQAGGSVATTPMPAMPDSTAIATAEQARYLAERQRIADQQSGNITRAFERGNEIQRGNRVMEDLFRGRHANPFSGRALQSERDTVRSRALADEASLGNFNAAIQGVEQGLANDRNTAAQEIMARSYQLEQDAKRYGLDYAQIFGQGPDGGPQTLAAQNADRGYDLDLAGLSGQLPGGGQTLAARNQAYQQMADARDFDYQAGRDARGDFVDDRNFNFQKAQQEWENTFRQGQFDYQKASDLWERTFKEKSFDQDVRQFAAQLGADYDRLDQAQQQFVAEMAYKNKAQQLDREKFDADQAYRGDALQLDRDKLALEESKAAEEPAPSASQAKNDVTAQAVAQLDTMDADERAAFFKGEKQNLIKSLGLSGYNSLFNMYYDKFGNPIER